jgi:hypothetical protein
MPLALLFAQAADPAVPGIVCAVPAEAPMDLVDEGEAKIKESSVILSAKESKKVANRKSIRPKVAFGMGTGRFEPRQTGKVPHNLPDKSAVGVSVHSLRPLVQEYGRLLFMSMSRNAAPMSRQREYFRFYH